MTRPRLNVFARFLFSACLVSFLVTGCGDDELDENSGTGDCPVGEQSNPITGTCTPIQGVNNSGAPDAGMPSDSGGNNTTNPDAAGNNNNNNPTDMGANDMAPGRCEEGVDQDGDGLDNACECELGTSPILADTDGDGIPDNEEDANQNCRIDIGEETDPRRADTDNDGLSDLYETQDPDFDPLNPDMDGDGVDDGVEVASGCMNPFDADTDGDGIPDGVEDSNADGKIGECPNRMFEYSCAQGESNPCDDDTDGDGTPDSEEAAYRECRESDTMGLPTANTVLNNNADYQFVLNNGVTSDGLTGPAGAEGHLFYDTSDGYNGFVVSLTPSGGQTNPSILEDDVLAQAQSAFPSAIRRLSGRSVTTHDGYSATVGSIIDLPAGTSLDDARSQILASLLGTTPANIAPTNTSGIAGDTSETLFLFSVVARGASQYVVSGAFTTLDRYQDNLADTGFRVDDLVGGTALASSTETAVPECVSYKITTKPQVDIIISIDGSGSMNEEQQALQNFAVQFTQLLTNSNLDWRAAVTLPNCNTVAGLGQEAADVLGPNCGSGQSCSADADCNFGGIPGFSSCENGWCTEPGFGGGVGALEGNGFTDDAATLENLLNPGLFSAAGEAPMAAVLAASDKALPRTANDPTKFRPEAAVILISITDEEDAWWQDGGSWGNTQNITLSATQQTELQNKAQSWIDYFLKQELGATVFGIVWPTGDQCITQLGCTTSSDCGQFGSCIDTDGDSNPDSCRTASAVAHAVSYVADETGGSTGSICQTDIANTLAEIANAAAGIASGLRLRGVPLTPTISVKRGNVQTGNVVDVSRSRADGYDYDGIVNRVVFEGPNPPQTNDTVVIPYRRWDGSVFTCTTSADCPSTQKLKCVDGECR